MNVEAIIDWADDGIQQQRDFESLEGLMIHRCGVDMKTGTVLGYDAKSVIREFLGLPGALYPEVAQATGGQNAYTFLIGGNLGPPTFDGRIWQALPIDEVGHHGRRFSVPYVGIGLIFDGRVAAPSEAQYNALVDLCAAICAAWMWNPYSDIKGHGEVAGSHGGNKAPGKSAACPGDLLNMNHLRDDVAGMMCDIGRQRLSEMGIVFT